MGHFGIFASLDTVWNLSSRGVGVFGSEGHETMDLCLPREALHCIADLPGC